MSASAELAPYFFPPISYQLNGALRDLSNCDLNAAIECSVIPFSPRPAARKLKKQHQASLRMGSPQVLASNRF
jgi:hypothetical protein